MSLLIHLLALVFCACGVAEHVGDWTLENFSRRCDDLGAACSYQFDIIENNFDEDGPRDKWPCSFTIISDDKSRPANQTGFQDVECELRLPTIYWVNGGWDPSGFIVIVVTDTNTKEYAFFGYRDDDIENGQSVETQTQPAYNAGSVGFDPRVARREVDAFALDSWKILDLQRRHTTSAYILVMEFDIQQNDDQTDHCSLIVQAPQGEQSVWTWSFYNQKCDDSDWYISWGYMDTGGAVMTVVNPEKSKNAWFGWQDVNVDQGLPDSGPSPAYPCQCG